MFRMRRTGNPSDSAGRPTAGHRAKALETAREHRLDALMFLVARVFERCRHRDDVRRIKARRL